MTDALIFAIPKGRILDEAIPLLRDIGIEPERAFFDSASRALTFATNHPDVRMIRVRAFDVATFVAHGAAHWGIVGSDVIDEFQYPDLYAPVDLGIGRCRLSLARPAQKTLAPHASGFVRVATKYPATARRYFAAQGITAECIKLNGAMEIAPVLGLADGIVDLVSSGRTLAENHLVETDVIAPVSARLIVNRAAYKLDHARLAPFIVRLRDRVGAMPTLAL